MFASSLFYLTQFASSQTTSETEEINKMIAEILTRAEKKNAEVVKNVWNYEITAGEQSFTKHYKERRRSPLKQTNSDLNSELVRIESQKRRGISSLEDAIPEFSRDEVHPVSETINDEDKVTEEYRKSFKGNHFKNTRCNTTLPMQRKIKQKHKFTSNTTQRVNYHGPRRTGEFYAQKTRGIIERITETIFKTTRPTTKLSKETIDTSTLQYKKTAEDTSKNHYETTTLDTKTKDKNPFSALQTDVDEYGDNIYKADYSENYNDEESNTNNTINSRYNSKSKLEHSTTELALALQDIETEVDSVPNYSKETTESIANLLAKMLENENKSEPDVTDDGDLKYSAISVYGKVHNEDPTPTVPLNNTTSCFDTLKVKIEDKPSRETKTSKIINNTPPSSDLYLLANNKNKELKAFFTLKSCCSPETTKTSVPIKHNFDSTTTEKNDKSMKPDLVAVYKEILEMYKDIKEMTTKKFENTTDKPKKCNKRLKCKMSWDKIKHFFGHDRVCSCKCKANKTMCNVCAASDAVIRELAFEFNNLADYMNQHCTEIQTYFWKNPSGGKKLRDSVHRIDKAMNDYYKRVKGKCNGRTCKTFSTCVNKRQYGSKIHNKQHLHDFIHKEPRNQWRDIN